MGSAVARVLAMIAIIIPMAGIIYLVIRFARQSAVASAWQATGANRSCGRWHAFGRGGGRRRRHGCGWARGTTDRSSRRSAASSATSCSPSASTRPSKSHMLRTADTRPAAATSRLAPGQRGVMRAMWDTRTALPTAAHPRMALVMVPKILRVGGAGGGSAAAPVDKGWVFPFDKPLAPGPDDSQALAVNTTNGTGPTKRRSRSSGRPTRRTRRTSTTRRPTRRASTAVPSRWLIRWCS